MVDDIPVVADSSRRGATESAVAIAIGARRARALTGVLRLVCHIVRPVMQWCNASQRGRYRRSRGSRIPFLRVLDERDRKRNGLGKFNGKKQGRDDAMEVASVNEERDGGCLRLPSSSHLFASGR